MKLGFGKEVRKYRKQHNIELDDIVKITGKEKSSWSEKEGERGDNPRMSSAREMASTIKAHIFINADMEEPIKLIDSSTGVQIFNAPYSEDDLKNLNDPDFHSYIILAKWIRKFGFDSPEVQDIRRDLKIN